MQLSSLHGAALALEIKCKFVATRGRQIRLPTYSEKVYVLRPISGVQEVAFSALVFFSFHVDANHGYSMELFVLPPLAACLSPTDCFFPLFITMACLITFSLSFSCFSSHSSPRWAFYFSVLTPNTQTLQYSRRHALASPTWRKLLNEDFAPKPSGIVCN